MNCTEADNLEFLKELNMDISNNENVCCISKEPLEDSHITLPCSHFFNYVPIYNEICYQKINHPLEVLKLKPNQIKCPYCRTVFNGLLPYHHRKDIQKKIGINSPLKDTIPLYKCQWIYKSGKNKNIKCNVTAGLYENGFFCNKHIYNSSKDNTVEKCTMVLKSGKNKGKICGCKRFEDGYCKRHLKK